MQLEPRFVSATHGEIDNRKIMEEALQDEPTRAFKRFKYCLWAWAFKEKIIVNERVQTFDISSVVHCSRAYQSS
jgi:hypothetical protein